MKKLQQFVFNQEDIDAISRVAVILKEIENAECISNYWTSADLDFLVTLAKSDNVSDKEKNCSLHNATRLLDSSNFSIEQKGEKA